MEEPPHPKELYDAIVGMMKAKEWLSITIYVLVFYAPAFLAWLNEKLAHRKVERLYKERLSDKDGEIERQSVRIKELEAQLLKRQRK